MACSLLFSACGKQSKPAHDEPRDAPAAQAVAVAPAPPPARSAKQTLARRCVLGGAPIANDCKGGDHGNLAFGKDGVLHVVAAKHVRRFVRAAGDDCVFEENAEPIALPPDNPRPQSVDGPVYMRSGGPAWHVTRAGDAVYAHDFLAGLFRIDRGKPEPACDDVFGFKEVAAIGKKLVIVRRGLEELRLGKQCKAVSAKLDDKARGEAYGVRDTLYVASGGDLHRYDGKTKVALGEGTRLCFVSGVTACGDGACVLDSNCMQLVQLAADGKVLRVLDDDKLFATRPYSVEEVVTSDDGSVYVLARHRDQAAGKEICETAIYELPAAVFAL